MKSYFIDGPSKGNTLALHTDSDGNPVSNMVTCVLTELDPVSVVNAGDPVLDRISFTQTVYYFVGCVNDTAFYTVDQSNQMSQSYNCIKAIYARLLEIRAEEMMSELYGMVGQEFVGVPRLGNELPMDTQEGTFSAEEMRDIRRRMEGATSLDPGDIGSQGTQTGIQTQATRGLTAESIEEAVRALSDSMPREWRGIVGSGNYFPHFLPTGRRGEISESRRDTIPQPPPVQAPDCSFCDAKKLQNFYGPGTRGNVCCPKCFKEREKNKLAKEVERGN